MTPCSAIFKKDRYHFRLQRLQSWQLRKITNSQQGITGYPHQRRIQGFEATLTEHDAPQRTAACGCPPWPRAMAALQSAAGVPGRRSLPLSTAQKGCGHSAYRADRHWQHPRSALRPGGGRSHHVLRSYANSAVTSPPNHP